MSLSTCDWCGGHIPLGPDASNRCEKCGRHVHDARSYIGTHIEVRSAEAYRIKQLERALRAVLTQLEEHYGKCLVYEPDECCKCAARSLLDDGRDT